MSKDREEKKITKRLQRKSIDDVIHEYSSLKKFRYLHVCKMEIFSGQEMKDCTQVLVRLRINSHSYCARVFFQIATYNFASLNFFKNRHYFPIQYRVSIVSLLRVARIQ